MAQVLGPARVAPAHQPSRPPSRGAVFPARAPTARARSSASTPHRASTHRPHSRSTPGSLLYYRQPPPRPTRHGRAGGGLRRPLQRRQVHGHQHPAATRSGSRSPRARPAARSTSTNFSVAPVKVPDPQAFLVDLPGYGYAEVSGSAKFHWQGLLSDYVADAPPQLAGLVLMMDARRPFTDLDCQMVEWFLPTRRPIHVLLTKADKLTNNESANALRQTRRILAEYSAQMDQSAADERPTVLEPQASRHRGSPARGGRGGCPCRGTSRPWPRRRPPPDSLSIEPAKKSPLQATGTNFPPVRGAGTRSGRSSGEAPALREDNTRLSASMIAGRHKSLVFLSARDRGRPAAGFRGDARRVIRPAFRRAQLSPRSRHVRFTRVPPPPHASRRLFAPSDASKIILARRPDLPGASSWKAQNQRQQVASMPGVERVSVDLLLPSRRSTASKLGIPVIALFPAIDPSIKTP